MVAAGVAVILVATWWLISSTGRTENLVLQPAGSAVEIPTLPSLTDLDPRMVEAVDAALERVRRSPENGQAHGDLGRIYHAHKYFDLARRCYENAHRLAPDTAAWPYYLGLFAAERGRLSDSIQYLQTAGALDPDYLPLHYHLGDVLLRSGHLEQAESAFVEYLDRAPESVWGHLGRARVSRQRDDLAGAITHLERALAIDADHREVLYLLARSYRSLGREAEARRLLEGIETRPIEHPQDPLLLRVYELRSDLQRLITRANQLLDQGQPEAAEAEYRAVLEFDAEHFDALFNLGVLTGRASRYVEAVSFLERAVRARPDRADAHFLLAMGYASSGRIDDAEHEAQETLRLQPGDRRALELLQQIAEGRARTGS